MRSKREKEAESDVQVSKTPKTQIISTPGRYVGLPSNHCFPSLHSHHARHHDGAPQNENSEEDASSFWHLTIVIFVFVLYCLFLPLNILLSYFAVCLGRCKTKYTETQH